MPVSVAAKSVEREHGARPVAGIVQEMPHWLPVAVVAGAVATLFFSLEVLGKLWKGDPQTFAAASVVLLAGAVLLCCAIAAVTGRSFDSRRVAFTFLTATAASLAAGYLVWVLPMLRYPGDFLIWSESEYVNDILKLRIHYPLYTAQVNNESFIYPPGSQLLTYLLASGFGHGASIPAFRFVQLCYALSAAFLGTLSCRRLAEATGLRAGRVWDALWLPVLFLAATNSITNPYVYNLHNDSLGQLINALGFFLLVCYLMKPRIGLLAGMAFIPAAGFIVKQSTAIWLVFFVIALAVFDPAKSWRRVLSFAAAAGGLLAGTMAVMYGIGGPDFLYWVFLVLGKHTVSPVRSAEHLLAIWPYYAILLAGGLILLGGPRLRPITGAWLAAFGLLTIETYTSGVAWMLNHIGPGCLLAAVWFFAALPRLWQHIETLSFPRWITTSASVSICALLFAGLGLLHPPVPALSEDALRYFGELDSQFAGHDPARVLMDVGSWKYLDKGIVMKDRATSIGERGYSQTGDFSGVLNRLRHQQYDKILVRNYHSPDFWYDHASWHASSGIRQALSENYRDAGSIRAASAQLWAPEQGLNYLFSEVTVLVPKRELISTSAGTSPRSTF